MRNNAEKGRKKEEYGEKLWSTHPHGLCIEITKHQVSALHFLRDLSVLKFSWKIFQQKPAVAIQ